MYLLFMLLAMLANPLLRGEEIDSIIHITFTLFLFLELIWNNTVHWLWWLVEGGRVVEKHFAQPKQVYSP